MTVRDEMRLLLGQIRSDLSVSSIVIVQREKLYVPTLVGVLLQYRQVYCRKSTVADLHAMSALSDCCVDVVQVSLFSRHFIIGAAKSDGVKWLNKQQRDLRCIQRDVSFAQQEATQQRDNADDNDDRAVVVWNWSMPTNFCDDAEKFIDSLVSYFGSTVQQSSSSKEFTAMRIELIKSVNGSFEL